MEFLHILVLIFAFCLGRHPVKGRAWPLLLGAILANLLWRINCAEDFIFYAIGMAIVCALDQIEKPTEHLRRTFVLCGIGFVSMSGLIWLTLWLSGQHLDFIADLREQSVVTTSIYSSLLRWTFGILLLIVMLMHGRQLQRSLSAKYIVSLCYLLVALVALIVNPVVLVPSSWIFWGITLFSLGWVVARHVRFNTRLPDFSEPDLRLSSKQTEHPLIVYGSLAVILLIAIGLRWAVMVPDQLLHPDSTQYLHRAEEMRAMRFLKPDYNLDEGFGSSRRLSPVYPALLAASSFLSSNPVHVGVAVSFAVSIATVVLCFLIGRTVHSNVAGLLAAAFLAFNPFVLRYATSVLTEPTFTFLFAATFFTALLSVERQSKSLLALTGLLAALSFLTREIGLICLALIVWGPLLYSVLFRCSTIGRSVGMISISLCFFLLTCLPHFIYVRAFTGHWGITPRMSVERIGQTILSIGGNPTARDSLQESEDYVRKVAQREARLKKNASITKMAGKVLRNSHGYLQSLMEKQGQLLYWAIVLGMIPFGFLSVQNGLSNLWRWIVLLSWGAALVLGYALVSPYLVDTRYLYPLMPLATVLAGIWIAEISRRISVGLREPVLAVSIPVLALLFSYGQLQPQIRAERWQASSLMLEKIDSAGHQEMAAELLREHPELRVVTRKVFAAYYLKARKSVSFPRSRQLGNPDADLLVADSHVLSKYRPQFRTLYSDAYQPQPGRIVYCKLFPEKCRVITVYDLRVQPEDRLPTHLGVEENLKLCRAQLQQNEIWQASQHCRAILAIDQRHAVGLELYAAIDLACSRATGMPWFPTKRADNQGEK